MNEQAPILEAKTRDRTGSRYSQRIRKQGGLPAVVYGHGEGPVSVSLDARDAIGHIIQGEKVFELKMGDKSQTVLLKDIQYDYLGSNIIHADFARVDMDERVEIRVPIKLIGDAVGLKSAGTILMHTLNEIEIECRVANLPEEIEVDISSVDVGQTLTAGDIKLPLDTMKLLTDPDSIVVQIVTQAEEVSDEQADVEGTDQPDVITEKKDEGEE